MDGVLATVQDLRYLGGPQTELRDGAVHGWGEATYVICLHRPRYLSPPSPLMAYLDHAG